MFVLHANKLMEENQVQGEMHIDVFWTSRKPNEWALETKHGDLNVIKV